MSSLGAVYCTRCTIIQKNYEIHNLSYELQVTQRGHCYTSYTESRFSAILRRISHNGLKKFSKIIEILC